MEAGAYSGDKGRSSPTADQRLSDLLVQQWDAPNAYYPQSLSKLGLTRYDLPTSVSELGRLPLTDKDFLRAGNYANRPNADVYKLVSTSGSTQAAVTLPHNYDMSRRTLFDNFAELINLNALDVHSFYGIGHWDPGQTTSGSYITFEFMCELWRSSPCLMAATREPMSQHLETIRLAEVDTIASAPGFLVNLANYINECGERVSIKNLIAGGAPLLTTDYEYLKSTFGFNKLVMFYPTTDAGGLGAQLGEGGDYLSFPDTHVFEIVRPSGEHVSPGEEGSVAVTALDSVAAPIIRYLVGDRAVFLGTRPEGGVRFKSIRRVADGHHR